MLQFLTWIYFRCDKILYILGYCDKEITPYYSRRFITSTLYEKLEQYPFTFQVSTPGKR